MSEADWPNWLLIGYVALATFGFQHEFTQIQRLLKEIRQLLWDLKARG